MTARNYCAVYDFDLMPYALGDVLTWNVQTAIRCEELGRERVDVYICLDERHPASIYQAGMVTAENCGLFFNELFGAFGTHPRLGTIVVYRSREDTLHQLRQLSLDDPAAAQSLADYEHALANRHDNDVLVEYFTKYIYYHEGINRFAAERGRTPLLSPSMGCEPDVAGLITRRLGNKRIVPIQIRMRRLDAGYQGEHTYARDSDFLEWYEFLLEAGKKYPDVQFVALGRLQEKPLEILKLPNVMSLRTYGLGLGHELTLMLKSDLIIGTSSGFAAMANFSKIPYFITRMTRESCNAYRIPYGAERLPFATEQQVLVYEPETRELLMQLLERGLRDIPPRRGTPVPALDPAIDVKSWEWERSQWLHPNATTGRFFLDDAYVDKETAFLVWPKLRELLAARRRGWKKAWASPVLARLETSFPRLCANFPEFLHLRSMLAVERHEWDVVRGCHANLKRLAIQENHHASSLGIFTKQLVWPSLETRFAIVLNRGLRIRKRYLAWIFMLTRRVKFVWQFKHRIPRKLMRMIKHFIFGQQAR